MLACFVEWVEFRIRFSITVSVSLSVSLYLSLSLSSSAVRLKLVPKCCQISSSPRCCRFQVCCMSATTHPQADTHTPTQTHSYTGLHSWTPKCATNLWACVMLARFFMTIFSCWHPLKHLLAFYTHRTRASWQLLSIWGLKYVSHEVPGTRVAAVAWRGLALVQLCLAKHVSSCFRCVVNVN